MAIEELPYKLAKLQSDHILIFNDWHPELERYFEGNYVLVHETALNWFPMKNASFDRYNTMSVQHH